MNMEDLEVLQAEIVQLHAMVESKKRAAEHLAALTTEVRQLEIAILQRMDEGNLESLGHAGLLAKVKKTIQYNAEAGNGWERIYARIQHTGEFELLHKRLSSTAVRERFNAGDNIDGVNMVLVPSLVITLQGGK